MSIIIFIIILGVLIFVHELGHFLVAKKSGVRVDEFAIGFPPRIFSFHRNGTDYSLNLIPFGGYVKIFGENPDEESSDPNAADSILNKSRWTQAAVLVAGVVFNVVFAWILLSISLMSGFPSVVTETTTGRITNAQVVLTNVIEESPAEMSGLKIGDAITSLSAGEESLTGEFSVADTQAFIGDNSDETISLTIERAGETEVVQVTPAEGVLQGRKAIGISMDLIGQIKLGFFAAFYEGFLMTGQLTKDVAVGLWTFLVQTVTGQANFSDVAGPVGIVDLVDDASNFGVVYLLGFTAFISLNLAVLNLLPFPALDGGRIVFVAIEGITRKPIKPKVANTLNGIGFALLILLMIIVTISDVIKLF